MTAEVLCVDVGKQTAVEIRHALEAATGGRLVAVHLAEQAADEIKGAQLLLTAFLNETAEDEIGQQAHVFGHKGDEQLQHEALRPCAILATLQQRPEQLRQLRGGLAGDFDAIVREQRLLRLRQQEGQRAPALRQIGQLDLIDGIKELLVEVVDPELIEVAQHDIRRAVWHDVRPVVERLIVMALQLRAA